jgi:hypothetical protein
VFEAFELFSRSTQRTLTVPLAGSLPLPTETECPFVRDTKCAGQASRGSVARLGALCGPDPPPASSLTSRTSGNSGDGPCRRRIG